MAVSRWNDTHKQYIFKSNRETGSGYRAREQHPFDAMNMIQIKFEAMESRDRVEKSQSLSKATIYRVVNAHFRLHIWPGPAAQKKQTYFTAVKLERFKRNVFRFFTFLFTSLCGIQCGHFLLQSFYYYISFFCLFSNLSISSIRLVAHVPMKIVYAIVNSIHSP